MLSLLICHWTWPPRRADCLARPLVCHKAMEVFPEVPCSMTQQASLPVCSSHYFLRAERQAVELNNFLQSFGMTRQGK